MPANVTLCNGNRWLGARHPVVEALIQELKYCFAPQGIGGCQGGNLGRFAKHIEVVIKITKCCLRMWRNLASESVQSPALALQSVDDIESCDGLAACVLGVGDGIPDDVLKEDLQDSPGLLINEARDTLDTSTTSQSTDSGLSDALDVVPEHLPVSLGASLSCMTKNSKYYICFRRNTSWKLETQYLTANKLCQIEKESSRSVVIFTGTVSRSPSPFPPLPRPDMSAAEVKLSICDAYGVYTFDGSEICWNSAWFDEHGGALYVERNLPLRG